MKQLANVFADYALTTEAFSPLGQSRFGQSLLLAWKREGEAQRKNMIGQVVIVDEFTDAICDVIKQLHPREERGKRGTFGRRDIEG